MKTMEDLRQLAQTDVVVKNGLELHYTYNVPVEEAMIEIIFALSNGMREQQRKIEHLINNRTHPLYIPYKEGEL